MIPNRFGMAMCFLFLFFTVTGAHYSNNLIFLFAFIVVSFLLIAILQTAKNLRGIDVLSVRLPNGFPTEPSAVDILVCNTKNIEKFGLGLQFKEQKDHVIVHEISPQDKKWVSHPFRLPGKRGSYRALRIKVFTDAPYGLFYGWYYLSPSAEGIVYPRPSGLPHDSKTPLSLGSDFSGIKEYQEGDPLQRISWKQSAKREDLLVKEFDDETPASEVFKLEDCPQSDIEGQLSQLALWLTQAEANHKTYALVLREPIAALGRGETHLHQCLAELGVYND